MPIFLSLRYCAAIAMNNQRKEKESMGDIILVYPDGSYFGTVTAYVLYKMAYVDEDNGESGILELKDIKEKNLQFELNCYR